MRMMRGILTTAIVAATTGASLTYILLTPRRTPAPTHTHHLSPPPELPSSSKLLIPNINNLTFLPESDIQARPSRCDYAPLWECLVNGNGGCEVLEQDLRVCLNEGKESEEPDAIVASSSSSQCDYAPLWECIVNGNGGCEVLETDFRSCLKRSEMMKP